MLLYAFLIQSNAYKYSYGRQANRTLPDILIPEISDLPKELISTKVKLPINNRIFEDKLNLDIKKWKIFKYGGKDGIFIIKNGYYNRKPDHTETGDIPFVGASMFNNGITDFYSIFDIETQNKDERSSEHEINQKIFKGNCITVANNGVGVGSAFYQPTDFTCSHDVNILYLKEREWNKYLALFVCTIIQLDKYRWAYGRKWRPSRMPTSQLKLPVLNNGKPDWTFMENFIKTLPYSAAI